jgi:hypothetical protein
MGAGVRAGRPPVVVLFNLATSVTLGLAVLTLYAGLLVLSVVGGAALIPQSVYDGNVGHAPALADYLKLGWLAATIATLAGALGSLIESDESVREAAYRHHADARTEETRTSARKRKRSADLHP